MIDVTSAPWWLQEGDEQCLNCEQYFHFEAMVYCVGCDGPLCSACAEVELETRQSFCSSCTGTTRGK